MKIITKTNLIILSVGALLLASFAPAAHAAGVAAEALERLGKLWGRVPAKGASEALEAAIKTEGKAAIRAAEHGGPALAETAARHGGEVFSFAARVPEAGPAIAAGAETLLPLARRYGDDILRIEARAPGLAGDAAHLFGGNAGHLADLAKMERSTLQKTLIYAQHTPNAVGRVAILKTAARQGEGFLGRLSAETARKGGFKMRHLALAALGGAVISHSPFEMLNVTGGILGAVFGWIIAIVGWAIVLAVAALCVWFACKLGLFSRIRTEWHRWKRAGRGAGNPAGTPV